MWADDIRSNATQEVTIILVGNQMDKEQYRQVGSEEGRNKGKQIQADLFFETSAMTGTNVQDVFYQTLEHIHQKDQPPAISEDTNGFRASVLSQQSIKQSKQKKDSCC